MNWYSGTLKLWHTDANAWGKPDYIHLMLSMDAAQRVLEDYPHPVAFAQYEPSPVSLTREEQTCSLVP